MVAECGVRARIRDKDKKMYITRSFPETWYKKIRREYEFAYQIFVSIFLSSCLGWNISNIFNVTVHDDVRVNDLLTSRKCHAEIIRHHPYI